MNKRRLINLIILLIVALHSVPALDKNEVTQSFNAVYAGVFSVVAAHTTIPRIELNGVTVDDVISDNLSYKLSFNRSDLATFVKDLNGKDDSSNWYSRLIRSARSSLSPLLGIASRQIESMGYNATDIILDGTLLLTFGSKSTLSSWIDLLILQDYSSVNFNIKLSIVVSGNALSEPLAFEGVLEGKGRSGERSVELVTDSMLCNGVNITISPMNFVFN